MTQVDVWDSSRSRVVALFFTVVACGGESASTLSRGEAAGMGGVTAGTGGSSGTAGLSAGVGGSAGGGTTSTGGSSAGAAAGSPAASGGACDQAVTSDLPAEVGCFVGTAAGWMKVPCACEIPLSNSTHAAATAELELTAVPQPSLTDAPDVEVTFPDEDASLYDAWSKQAALAGTFSVTASAGGTTVRLGASDVVLAPVSIAACRDLIGEAHVSGSDTHLSTHATFTDSTGNVVLTSDGTCFNPPHL